MKKNILILLTVVFLSLITSCGIHNGLTTNSNGHNTEVQLNKKNFKVIKSIKGVSSASYFFGIGGIGKTALIANARAEMLKDAGLEGSARAVINETVEIQISSIVIYNKYTVTVSAHVIEFTE